MLPGRKFVYLKQQIHLQRGIAVSILLFHSFRFESKHFHVTLYNLFWTRGPKHTQFQPKTSYPSRVWFLNHNSVTGSFKKLGPESPAMQIGKARVNPDNLSSLADPKPLLASAFSVCLKVL